ncbi:MAG TPA: amino acid ABC transporter substrate-binding protein [Candidatus Limnocylindria bacterium]|nr:amino acid ABC transporter substrate-binding protein [Candidatus Limnocylindria bacterium]
MTRPIWILGVLVLALVMAACGDQAPSPTGPQESTPAVTGSPGESAPEGSEPPPSSGTGRLGTVQERGQLICGVNGSLPGFSFLDEDGNETGFDADFCRALAAAVLGDPEAVEFRAVNADQRGPALQTGEVDVLIRNTTWTVSRDTSWGLFAPTTFYDGQAIMVNSTLTDATAIDELEGATICVQSGTTTELNLADRLGDTIEPLVFPEIDPTYAAYEEGRCDAVTSDRSQLVAQRTGFENPDDHLILDEVMSKEPLGPVAPLGDDQWFNVVKWVVFATIEAEELGITQDNVADMVTSSDDPVVQRLLGVTPEGAEPFESGLGLEADWVVTMIGAVGNYGEIYDRNLGPGTPFDLERGLNSLWTDGGLLYAPPFR